MKETTPIPSEFGNELNTIYFRRLRMSAIAYLIGDIKDSELENKWLGIPPFHSERQAQKALDSCSSYLEKR